MIKLEKVNNIFMSRLIRIVNDNICSIPSLPKETCLNDSFYTGFGYRFWYIRDKGYFGILRIYDHAEVTVKFFGQSATEFTSSIFEEQIELYYPYIYTSTELPSHNLRDFHDYCYSHAHLESSYSAYDVSTNMREVSILIFLKEFLPQSDIIKKFTSTPYFNHRMCFDQKLGYLYIIPSTKGDLCVYQIGREKEEAFSNLMDVAEKDTLNLSWKW